MMNYVDDGLTMDERYIVTLNKVYKDIVERACRPNNDGSWCVVGGTYQSPTASERAIHKGDIVIYVIAEYSASSYLLDLATAKVLSESRGAADLACNYESKWHDIETAKQLGLTLYDEYLASKGGAKP